MEISFALLHAVGTCPAVIVVVVLKSSEIIWSILEGIGCNGQVVGLYDKMTWKKCTNGREGES